MFSPFWEKLRAIQKDRDIYFLGNQPLSIKHPRIALTHAPPELYRDSCEALLGEHQLGNNANGGHKTDGSMAVKMTAHLSTEMTKVSG